MNSCQQQRSNAQRSMIPVARRTPSDGHNNSNAVSISNINSLSNQEQSPPKEVAKNHRASDLQIQSFRSVSKSDSTLSEKTLTRLYKSKSRNSTSAANEFWKRNLPEELSESSVTSFNSTHNSTTSSSSRDYSSANIQINFQRVEKSTRCNVAQSSSFDDSLTPKKPNFNIPSIAKPSRNKDKPVLSGASREIDQTVAKRSLSIKPKKDESIGAFCDAIGTNSSPVSSGSACNCGRQLERQLQDKDLQIVQLEKMVNEKERMLDDLYFELEEKDQQIDQLVDEIRKRKQDLVEMSRRIINMDQEIKACRTAQIPLELGGSTSRPFSPLSCDSCCSAERANGVNKWFSIAPLSSFKKTSKTKSSQKSNDEYIQELKRILREKEMIITDMRLDSKLTLHRLDEMENILRRKEEETLVIKKNNDYLEKAVKSKLID